MNVQQLLIEVIDLLTTVQEQYKILNPELVGSAAHTLEMAEKELDYNETQIIQSQVKQKKLH